MGETIFYWLFALVVVAGFFPADLHQLSRLSSLAINNSIVELPYQ